MNTVLVEEIENVKHDIMKDFAETTKLNVKWKQNVVSIIMDKIWGCEEKCMFCREPCQNTDKSNVSDDIDHQWI